MSNSVTLERPPVAPEAPPVAPEPPPAPEAPVRACAACGAGMAAEQHWCLECGTAAPGRAGGRHAWRAAGAIVGAVLVLVGGAVAVSYAALSSDAQRQAAAPPAASGQPRVAQVAPPPSIPAPPAPAPATPPPAASPAGPPPVAQSATPAPAPAPAAPPSAPAKPKPTGPSAKPGLQPVDLGPDAASVYDPYQKAVDQTDPADSYDGDPKTVFTVTTAAGQPQMGVGVDYDLDTARGVRALELRTTTPGFRLEVYGAKDKLPPDILDTRWTHLRSVEDVGTKAKDGVVKVIFPAGRYRHVLLWFTTPPPAGPTVGIAEARLLD